jgi:predicted Zn-dependent peptidase
MALKDIRVELDKLSSELVSADELDLVRNCMLGDFMRSIDGIFERSERFCQMLTNGITESFTDNYFDVLTPESPHAITPEKIQSLAAKIFAPEEMTVVTVGRKD